MSLLIPPGEKGFGEDSSSLIDAKIKDPLKRNKSIFVLFQNPFMLTCILKLYSAKAVHESRIMKDYDSASIKLLK